MSFYLKPQRAVKKASKALQQNKEECWHHIPFLYYLRWGKKEKLIKKSPAFDLQQKENYCKQKILPRLRSVIVQTTC